MEYRLISDEAGTDLKCILCLKVAKEPLQHQECGRLLCKECWYQHKRDYNHCPHCKSEKPVFFHDKKGNM